MEGQRRKKAIHPPKKKRTPPGIAPKRMSQPTAKAQKVVEPAKPAAPEREVYERVKTQSQRKFKR